MAKHAKKPVAPKTKDLTITPEQMSLIVGLNQELGLVQQRLNLVCAGIVAGHGYGKPVRVSRIDPDTNVITIVEP